MLYDDPIITIYWAINQWRIFMGKFYIVSNRQKVMKTKIFHFIQYKKRKKINSEK